MIMTRPEFKERLHKAAHGWVGVPFLHNGRVKSQGVDCLGLALCLFREVGIAVPDTSGEQYAPDWYLHTPEDRYLTGLLVHGVAVDRDRLRPGDALYFRPGLLSYSRSEMITHAGLFLGGEEFVHAVTGRPVQIASLTYKAWKISYAGAIRPHIVLEALGEVA